MREELETLRRRFGGHTPTLLGERHRYAVLCPLVEREDGLHFLYEVRAAPSVRAGEVCFPGGRMETGESPAECALRETEEELAIPAPGDHAAGHAGFYLQPGGLFAAAGAGRGLRPGLCGHASLPRGGGDVFTAPRPFSATRPPSRGTMTCCPGCRRTSPTRPWASPGTMPGPGGRWTFPSGTGRATPSGA